MSKYAVNEPGAAALRSMASAIDEAVEQLVSLISGIQSTADEYDDSLGPHKASLDDVLEEISESLKQATDPANAVSEKLNDLADEYQEIIENNRIKGSGK